jgi:hypothetical protein
VWPGHGECGHGGTFLGLSIIAIQKTNDHVFGPLNIATTDGGKASGVVNNAIDQSLIGLVVLAQN